MHALTFFTYSIITSLVYPLQRNLITCAAGMEECNTLEGLSKVFFFLSAKIYRKSNLGFKWKSPISCQIGHPDTPQRLPLKRSRELPLAVTFPESCHHHWKQNGFLRFMPIFWLLTQLRDWQIKHLLKNQTGSVFLQTHCQNITLYMLWKKAQARADVQMSIWARY